MEALSSFGPYIARYEGLGTLRLPKRRQARVAFDLRQLDNGQLVVAYQSDRSIDMFDADRLVGSTADGGSLRIEDLQALSSTFRSHGISHGVSYARMAARTSGGRGAEPRPYFDFSLVNLVLPEWTLKERPIYLHTQDHRFSIRPVEAYRDAARQLERASGVRVTAKCRVRRKDHHPLTTSDAIAATDDLCVALSLCIGSKVNWITVEDGHWYRQHQSRVTKGYSSWINALDWTLRSQRALTAWSRSANHAYFGAMVDYFMDAAGRGPYMETRALTAASLLDAITGEYSRLSGLESWVDDSTWAALRPSLVGAIDQSARSAGVSAPLSSGVDALQRRSFRRRLRELLSAHYLPTARLDDIIRVRNSIVHYGRLPSGMKPLSAYEIVLWASFVVLARLIGYRGGLPDPPT